MKWEKLCVTKVSGERGFRDLHQFNIALLGKMAWGLLTEPEDLVCQLLRAKYYPNGTFLDARPEEILAIHGLAFLLAKS